jgi:hypothetical protein
MTGSKINIAVGPTESFVTRDVYTVEIMECHHRETGVNLGQWHEVAGRGSTRRSLHVEYEDIPALIEKLSQVLLERMLMEQQQNELTH